MRRIADEQRLRLTRYGLPAYAKRMYKPYREILAEARLIHPKATVESVDGFWRISYPTSYKEPVTLGPEFDGTPAAERHAELESGESGLDRHARKNGCGHLPTEVYAMYFNANAAMDAAGRAKMEELFFKDTGLVLNEVMSDWSTAGNYREAYHAARNSPEVEKIMEELSQKAEAILDDYHGN